MPLPLIPLAIGAAQALPKLYQAFSQNAASKRVTLQDSRPESFRRKLGMAEQAAATSQLPNLGLLQNRVGQTFNGVAQNARLGAGSGSDFLAATTAAASQRQQAELQLGAQGLQYQDQSRQRLGQTLDQDAAYRTNDLNNYNREKAGLVQGAAENLNNAVGGAASYAALAYNMGQDGYGMNDNQTADAAVGTPLDYRTQPLGGIAPAPLPTQLPALPSVNGAPNLTRYRYGLGGGRYANRSQRYGF